MRPSMNEIAVETKKAARGSGFSWGMAEEVGHAMAWLAQNGVNPLPALLDLLDCPAGSQDVSRDVASALRGEPTADTMLCPVSLGVAIVDRADQLMAGRQVDCGPVFRPILLLPFVDMAAQIARRVLILDGGFGAWRFWPDRVDRDQLATAAEVAVVPHVICRVDQATLPVAEPPADVVRLDMQADLWRRLQTLAARTYVPASEQSRTLGAGAGAIDND